MTAQSEHSADPTAIDRLTGGALTASTAQARIQLIKVWLESTPAPSYEQLNDVFKLLSAKDKGAARPVREAMDEIKKAQSQEALTALWADKANELLSSNKLNIADAMAWQRDAAKEGAPISKEPLSSLRGALADRVKTIEDLQHRAQVQREAAVLLAQRIEVLSTKYWEEAQSLEGTLSSDVQRWSTEHSDLLSQKDWSSVDPKYTPALQTSAEHLKLVWEAFSAALKQAALSALDPTQALPAVPAWADQIKQKRADTGSADENAKPGQQPQPKKKVDIDPAVKAQAKQVMQDSMGVLEKELAQGHGKASAGAASNLRQALKEYGQIIDQRIERHAQSLLLAAGELEGWQRWRADQIRNELVAKAEGLLERVKPRVEIKGSKPNQKKTAQSKNQSDSGEPSKSQAPDAASQFSAAGEAHIIEAQISEATHQDSQIVSPESKPVAPDLPISGSAEALVSTVQQPEVPNQTVETSDSVTAASGDTKNKPNPDFVPTMGPRKLQETLRKLREDWKATDQGGMPNHALWKRFDNACNLAYPFVHEWLQQTRAQSQAHKAQRMELIAEVKAWAELHSKGPDWRVVQRQLHDFSERWRACGHVSEKVFAELQVLWKEAIHNAHLPIETLQNESIARRKALIAESKVLGAQATLKIEPIKALQQRWQDESHVVPIDRKLAQRLWDDFKKPLDEAFQRKSAERAQVAQSMSAHDELVLNASKALEQAIKEADATKIKAAMQHLHEVSLHGESIVKAQPTPSITGAVVSGSDTALTEHTEKTPELSSHSEVTQPQGLVVEEAQADVGGQGAVTADGASPEAPSTTETSESSEGAEVNEASVISEAQVSPASSVASVTAVAPVAPKPPKAVVAVRGDDRPGANRSDARSVQDSRGRPGSGPGSSRGGKDQRDSRGPRDSKPTGASRTGQFGQARDFKDSRDGRDSREPRGPRLGDAAFRAQRQALEAAEIAMRKLAAQAHGQTLTNLMSAWKDKNPELVPALKELGSRINANQRLSWTKAIQTGADKLNQEALLRLEMAANAPTPASDLQARRDLQLKLLTKRNDPSPAQTWAEDAAGVFAGPYDADVATRLQTVLKTMLKH